MDANSTADMTLALAMNPLYMGVSGGKPSQMLTMNEVRFNLINKKCNKSVKNKSDGLSKGN